MDSPQVGPADSTSHYHYKNRQLKQWTEITQRGSPDEERPVSPPLRPVSPTLRPQSTQPGAVRPGSVLRATNSPPRASTPGAWLRSADGAEMLSSSGGMTRSRCVSVPQSRQSILRPLRNRFRATNRVLGTPMHSAEVTSPLHTITQTDFRSTWFRHNRRRGRPVSHEYHRRAPAPNLGLRKTGLRDYTGLGNVLDAKGPWRAPKRTPPADELREVESLDDWIGLSQSEITVLARNILTKYKMGKWIPDAATVWDYHLEKSVSVEQERIKNEAERLHQIELEEQRSRPPSSLYARLQCEDTEGDV